MSINVKEMTVAYLKQHGYDGLADENGCGCGLDNLVECGEGPFPDCCAARKYTLPEDGSDLYVNGERVLIEEGLPGDVIYLAADEAEGSICGLCGEGGADKVPDSVHWPGERRPATRLVHEHCENEECLRASEALTSEEREAFLRSL